MKNKIKRMEYEIDNAQQGAAALFVGCSIKGHKLVKLERKNSKVICWYENVKSNANK